MVRFIDDLTAINDGGEFEKIYREMYPPELQLKRENSSDNQASFFESDHKNCIQTVFPKFV